MNFNIRNIVSFFFGSNFVALFENVYNFDKKFQSNPKIWYVKYVFFCLFELSFFGKSRELEMVKEEKGDLLRFFQGHDALVQVSPAASPTTCYHLPFALALLPLEDCCLPPNLPFVPGGPCARAACPIGDGASDAAAD
jgi:hypothetical protein